MNSLVTYARYKVLLRLFSYHALVDVEPHPQIGSTDHIFLFRDGDEIWEWIEDQEVTSQVHRVSDAMTFLAIPNLTHAIAFKLRFCN